MRHLRKEFSVELHGRAKTSNKTSENAFTMIILCTKYGDVLEFSPHDIDSDVANYIAKNYMSILRLTDILAKTLFEMRVKELKLTLDEGSVLITKDKNIVKIEITLT